MYLYFDAININVNVYESRFLAEGDFDPLYDVPPYSIYKVSFRYDGKNYATTVRVNSLHEKESAIAPAVAKVLRSLGVESNGILTDTIFNIKHFPKNYNLKVEYKEDVKKPTNMRELFKKKRRPTRSPSA